MEVIHNYHCHAFKRLTENNKLPQHAHLSDGDILKMANGQTIRAFYEARFLCVR